MTTKICSRINDNTKICSIFANRIIMQQSNEWMEVTYEEKELLESIRNYNRSFPDGYPELLWYAQELFDNLVRQPYF